MKITRKGIEKKLNEITKEIVFARDSEGCVTCPIWKKIKPDFEGSWIMQPGHLFTRGAKSVKWDLRNVYKQCKTCNFLHEYHPDILTQYAVKVLGKKGYEKLVFDRHQVRRFVMPELEELYEKLKKQLNEN